MHQICLRFVECLARRICGMHFCFLTMSFCDSKCIICHFLVQPMSINLCCNKIPVLFCAYEMVHTLNLYNLQ